MKSMWIKKKDYEVLKNRAEQYDRLLDNIKKNRVIYIEDSYVVMPIEKYQLTNKALLKIEDIIKGLNHEN